MENPITVCSEITDTLSIEENSLLFRKMVVCFTQITLKYTPNFYYELYFQVGQGVLII